MPEIEKAEGRPRRHRILLRELRRRTWWFVRMRWAVPAFILAGALVAQALGFAFNLPGILATGLFILAYNTGFYAIGRRVMIREGREQLVQRFTYIQVGFDYAAMCLLVYFTGGVGSPLIAFFIFHVIFASILLPPRAAYGFAGLVTLSLVLITAGQSAGLVPEYKIAFGGQTINAAADLPLLAVSVAFFAAAVFITAFSTTGIMRMLRSRIVALDEASTEVLELNDKLRTLYLVIEAIGSNQNLERVLDIAKSELRRVMGVRAISVKLLSPDGKLLRYAAAEGLPDSLLVKNTVVVERSPLNKKIIEGEPYVTGNISQQEQFQFGEDLAQAGLHSVLFVPLKVEERVIGILGAYCTDPDRFSRQDVDFFELAADLVAIALENARAYQEIEGLIQERSRFMLRVAHNLRAPLAATISILGVVRDEYLGALNAEQSEYLRRVDRRARSMMDTINQLLTLSRSRTEQGFHRKEKVDFGALAKRLARTFEEPARAKGLGFQVVVAPDPPPVIGDPELLEQVLENLTSNAIKYTKTGTVEVRMAAQDGHLQIVVSDTGIGIPSEEIPRLFTEFFRGEGARQLEEIGTGLGLALVRETVERHGGRIDVQSEVGHGSTFTVVFPAAE